MPQRCKTFFFSRPSGKRVWFTLACALMILCLTPSALAQSGRRVPKGTAAPAPAPTPSADAQADAKAAAAPAQKPAAALTLLVGGDRLSASFDTLPGYMDIVLNACIQRLEKVQSIAVNAGGSHMTRGEAVDAAKRQKESHVVWLEMKIERNSSVQTDVVVEFYVFKPETAKIEGSGRIYLDGSRRVGGVVGVGVPSVTRRLPLDYLAKEAGREIAERVLNLFRGDLSDK